MRALHCLANFTGRTSSMWPPFRFASAWPACSTTSASFSATSNRTAYISATSAVSSSAATAHNCCIGPTAANTIRAEAFAHVLTKCLFAGARWTDGAPKNVQIKLSTRPKQEVAIGLVVQSTLRDAEEHWDDVIAGEPFSMNGTHKLETDLMGREDLALAEISGLPELQTFFKTYVQVAESMGYPRLSLPEDALFTRALERVRQFMADQKTQASDQAELVPPFIRGLQALLLGIAKDADRSRVR